MQRRMDRWARWAAWLVMLGVMVSCATAEAAARSTDGPRSLEAVIAESMQGAQLDVWGGGSPSPGRTTTLFVHHGHAAAELYWTTDGWCLARELRWTIEDVHSATNFRVRYVATEQYPSCLMDTGRVEELQVVGTDDAAGLLRLTAVWRPGDTWTVRTRCSVRWDDPAPCGFTEVFALVPSM